MLLYYSDILHTEIDFSGTATSNIYFTGFFSKDSSKTVLSILFGFLCLFFSRLILIMLTVLLQAWKKSKL